MIVTLATFAEVTQEPPAIILYPNAEVRSLQQMECEIVMRMIDSEDPSMVIIYSFHQVPGKPPMLYSMRQEVPTGDDLAQLDRILSGLVVDIAGRPVKA